ncbi:hypothetical protein [Nocardia abscessus]|uniref:hypothetical protein n=1 Tax=Nocardia abscessus TaxID=120957 RepID=UPI00031B5542|nr:hypothetical protein [Nocardia abscessus]MCC3332589.1 hypothetical protein [Nocardia abscessus]
MRWVHLLWPAVVLLLSAPLLVGWKTTTEHTSTVLVVGLRDEGAHLDLDEQLRQEMNFSGPILVVAEPQCFPPLLCPPAAYYQPLGSWAAGDGSVAIGPHGDRLYHVTITRRDFGWWPALGTAFLIPLVVALVYFGAEWVRVHAGHSSTRRVAGERGIEPRSGGGHGAAPNGRRSTEVGPEPQATPWLKGRQAVHPPPTAHAVRTADLPAPHAPRTADLPATREAPRAVVPVHVDASGLPEIAELFAEGGHRGTARTHIDAAGGYAEFGELVLWVDNARPDSVTGVPGDVVQVIPVARNAFRR